MPSIMLIEQNVFCREEKDDTLSAISIGSLKPEIASGQAASSHTITTPTLPGSSITGNVVPTATPEIDEDEYSKPAMDSWDKNGSPQKSEFRGSSTYSCRWLVTLLPGNFYSSSDSESEDEIERKIHVEIKPLNNGTAPISASVDELRATVENLSLSPIGALSVKFAFLLWCLITRDGRGLDRYLTTTQNFPIFSTRITHGAFSALIFRLKNVSYGDVWD